MKLGIMQPYFMPYIGYWQLINAVDKYVIYDDVNFIKGGWINRNKILINGHPQYFNVPMLGASVHKKINEIAVNNDVRLVEKNLRMIEGAYKKAPYYAEVYPLVESILRYKADNIAEYNGYSLKILGEYLGITTELIFSSKLEKDNSLKAQDKVIHICELLEATEYYNAIGGKELYSAADFKKKGIELKFLRSDNIQYEQFGGEFQENLSILDVIMFNDRETVHQLLDCYELVLGDIVV